MAWCSYGYDPLGLGKDTAQVEKYREYELIHARWAMLAAAGIIIPEGLQVKTAPLLPCRDHPNCRKILHNARKLCSLWLRDVIVLA